MKLTAVFVSMTADVPQRCVDADGEDAQQFSEHQQAGRTQRHERLENQPSLHQSAINDTDGYVLQKTWVDCNALKCGVSLR